MALVELSESGGIGTLALNDPATRNALSSALVEELVERLDHLRKQQARLVVIRARRGAKTWSSGHDVRELPKGGRDPLTYSDPMRNVIRQIQEFPGPVVAVVEGGVWGGAFELITSCDLVIAADTATFAITPARIGLPYDIVGVLNLMQSVSMVLIKEMLFRAQPISAARALEAGVINRVVPAELLDATLSEVATDIGRNSPLVISLLKQELRELASARPLSAGTYERLQAIRRQIYDSDDYKEGLRAFFEKRTPSFTGH
ncbi:MAG TPA: methylmalonyl-CoA decarboxylase [Thermoplasmata archaeon]|nr:methylmalonyl-CoA decarboxylase [Thermoplasmata archaeon]